MKNLLTILAVLFCMTSFSQTKTTQTNVSWGNIFYVIFNGNLPWENSGTWDNGVPAVGDTVIVRLPTNFSTTSNLETLGDLEIRSELDVLAGNTLRVTNEVRLVNNEIVVNGNFIIVGDSINYGRVSEASGGNISGNFTYEKWVDRCNKWSIYGGPFDVSLNEIADSAAGQMIYTGFANSDYPSFSWVNTYLYDEDWSNVGWNGWVTPDGNNVIPRGTGFWYWNSDTVYGGGSGPIIQKWKVATEGSIDFNSTFNFTVGYTNTGDISSDGWNLMANPYPGTIDWDATSWSLTNVDNAIYEFNTCNQSYSSYVGGVGTNGGDRYISPFQGFYIKANNNSPALSCDGSVINQSAEMLKSSNPLDNVLRIFFNDDEIIVRANDLASDDFNSELDAYKFMNDSSKIYSKVYTDTIKYSINSINDSTPSIPLYTIGGGTLDFYELSTWSSYYDLYLEDLVAGTMMSINSIGGSYSFVESDSAYINRFVIHLFAGSSLDIQENVDSQLTALYDGDEIIIKSTYQNNPVTIEVYNMLGQIVSSDVVIITPEGYRMNRLGQLSIVRIVNSEIDKSIKVF